jgi:hypothetical protein
MGGVPMTRLQIANMAPQFPPSIRLGELAIAAGMAGFPVTLCYQDFFAPLLSQVWSHYIRSVGSDAVHHVHTQRDLNKLPERMSDVRVVFVHTPRLHLPTAWSIQLSGSAGDETVSRPAVLSRFVPDDLEDDPGATLIVRATTQENEAVARWFATRQNFGDETRVASSPITIEVPAWLSPVLSRSSNANSYRRHWFRNNQILRSLVAGACVLRSCGASDTEAALATPDLEDYELVRGLLRSPVLWPADVACDPLATDMVRRANVYLAAKTGEVRRYGSPFLVRDDDNARYEDGRSVKEPITRREIADLGNVQSGIVRRLVDFLHQGADGREWYCRMGLVRRPPDRNDWGAASLGSLTASLRPWSAKQVRTHFDRLRRDGLITAERDFGNSPWRYELPDELTDTSSLFRNLPPAQELLGGEPDATGDSEA